MDSAIPDNAWVVIADGTRASYYRASVRDGAVSLSSMADQSPERLDDDGPAGKRPKEQSQQQTDEATFAKQLANSLYTHAHADHFQQLVLVADPQTLGQLRSCMHAEVTSRIVTEIPKTLTTMPLPDIEKALSR